MQEIYITITKTAAPAGTRNGCKNTSTHENVGTPIVRRKKRRVNRYRAAVIGVREALIKRGRVAACSVHGARLLGNRR